ncbi:MAG: tyrosinase family protein [Alphaproteobacteria bacterium]|nr:tyrosinase family protein [Alphaproteobacteria bacterium]
MASISRRSVLAGGAAGVALGALPFPVWFARQAAAAPKVRYDASSGPGKAMLVSLANGVDAMSKLPESDPRSWVFQWYTHWVRSDTTKQAEMARIFPDPTTSGYKLAAEMWDMCQSHGAVGDSVYHFLPWHRMYAYFFERIIAKLSGDPNFTLPYWNYLDTNLRAIPPEFRVPGGPLYRAERNAGVNAGDPVDKNAPGAISPSSLAAQQFVDGTLAGSGFSNSLNNGLHGTIHVLVGNGQNMGAIPWAARDPVFWMHHCMVDRMWASWNLAGRKNPEDAAWLGKEFVFVDENGQRVLAKTGDFSSMPGYVYDTYVPVPATIPRLPVPVLAEALPAPTPPITLGARPVAVQVAKAGASRTLSSVAARPALLVVASLSADQQPGVIYNVYIDLPPNASPAQARKHLAGTVNFFGATRHHDVSRKPTGLTLDVTETVNKLASAGKLRAQPVVTFAPAGAPAAEAKPVVGGVSLVRG